MFYANLLVRQERWIIVKPKWIDLESYYFTPMRVGTGNNLI